MLRLPLQVGFGDQRTAQPITRIHQTEQALALAHAQPHVKALLQTLDQTAAIPKAGVQAGDRRRLAHPPLHGFQLLGREPGGTPGVIAFGQTRQTPEVELPHPVDERARRVAEETSHRLATQAGSDEQDARQSVIIAGILMAINFLLQHSATVLRR